MITVTESAVKQLQALLADVPGSAAKGSKGLRLFVETGGCCGLQYGMALDHDKEGDEIIELEGVRMLIDSFSLRQLRGSTIDFSDDREGFSIRNPNAAAAARTCGCGDTLPDDSHASNPHP
jgi:iron-sulfur cluster assembly accessory protein